MGPAGGVSRGGDVPEHQEMSVLSGRRTPVITLNHVLMK